MSFELTQQIGMDNSTGQLGYLTSVSAEALVKRSQEVQSNSKVYIVALAAINGYKRRCSPAASSVSE